MPAILINPFLTVPILLVLGAILGLLLPKYATWSLAAIAVGFAGYGLQWLHSLHNDAGWGLLLPVDVMINGLTFAIALLLGTLLRYLVRWTDKG